MEQNYYLNGDGYVLKPLANQFYEQAEVLQEKASMLQTNLALLTTGKDGWTGVAAQSYTRAAELMYNNMQKLMLAYDQMGNALKQVGDRLIALGFMRARIQEIHQRMIAIAYQQRGEVLDNSSEYHYLQQELDRLSDEERRIDKSYSKDAVDAFQEINKSLPAIGQMTNDIKSLFLMDGFLGEGPIPRLLRLDFANGKSGRERVDLLNETILQNGLVIAYYQAHPDAKGPNGETAAEMIEQAQKLQSTARKQGGTYGVPIIFMHGLWGNDSTFAKMTEHFGGYSKQYTWYDGKQIQDVDGLNDTTSNPIIQFSFDDGDMTFDKQTQGFKEMMDRVKETYNTDTVMVVSHSMGGVITTKYIEDTGGDDISKFVTLGSPITGSRADADFQEILTPVAVTVDSVAPAVAELATGSHENLQIYNNKNKFNPNIQVFSGAGTGMGILGDGVVTPDSALALQDFTDANHFSSKIYADATHSELHEEMQEINDTIGFLLYGEKPSDQQ